jgi:hypothetical protein
MRVAPGASLAVVAPDLAKEWHPVKNGRLSPRDVASTATRVVWWQCARNPAHEWRASVSSRTSGDTCPACDAIVPPSVREPREDPRSTRARPYVLYLDFDPDRRLTLVFFLRSRDIDVFGVRDAVEARRHAADHGPPRVVLFAEDSSDLVASFPGIPRRRVPGEALRAWLVDPNASAESMPVLLQDIEAFVATAIRSSS